MSNMTAQVHERLILDGKELSLACEPTIPEHPRIINISGEEASASNPLVFSTACWRNYIGSWEIKDGRLYLTSIVGIYKLIGDSPISAEWYTGTLRVPTGSMREYVHMGYGSTYERELYIDVRNGDVVGQHEQTS